MVKTSLESQELSRGDTSQPLLHTSSPVFVEARVSHVDGIPVLPSVRRKCLLEHLTNCKTDDDVFRWCPGNGCLECLDYILDTIDHLGPDDLNSEARERMKRVRSRIVARLVALGWNVDDFAHKNDDHHRESSHQLYQSSRSARECRCNCAPAAELNDKPQSDFPKSGTRRQNLPWKSETWRDGFEEMIRNVKTRIESISAYCKQVEQRCQEMSRTMSLLDRTVEHLEMKPKEICEKSLVVENQNAQDHPVREGD